MSLLDWAALDTPQTDQNRIGRSLEWTSYANTERKRGICMNEFINERCRCQWGSCLDEVENPREILTPACFSTW